MYDEWGNDIGTAPTWFLTHNGEPSPFDVDITPPLSVVSKGEDPLVLPGPTGETSLRLLDDPFVLPGPDSDYGFGLKQGSDDWLVPLSNPGETTLPPLPPVTGDRTQPTTPRFWNPYDGGLDGHDSDPPEPPTPDFPLMPNCNDAEDIGQLQAPDGAKYYVPEGITAEYILRAIDHLSSIEDPEFKWLAFYDMYTNPGSEFFIDFKDWEGVSPISYYSESLGAWVNASPFEAFGNYLYGFIGVVGGIDPAILNWAAGVLQTGNNLYERVLGRDDPQDRPHVEKGILDALQYIKDRSEGKENPIFTIIMGNCISGTTGVGSV